MAASQEQAVQWGKARAAFSALRRDSSSLPDTATLYNDKNLGANMWVFLNEGGGYLVSEVTVLTGTSFVDDPIERDVSENDYDFVGSTWIGMYKTTNESPVTGGFYVKYDAKDKVLYLASDAENIFKMSSDAKYKYLKWLGGEDFDFEPTETATTREVSSDEEYALVRAFLGDFAALEGKSPTLLSVALKKVIQSYAAPKVVLDIDKITGVTRDVEAAEDVEEDANDDAEDESPVPVVGADDDPDDEEIEEEEEDAHPAVAPTEVEEFSDVEDMEEDANDDEEIEKEEDARPAVAPAEAEREDAEEFTEKIDSLTNELNARKKINALLESNAKETKAEVEKLRKNLLTAAGLRNEIETLRENVKTTKTALEHCENERAKEKKNTDEAITALTAKLSINEHQMADLRTTASAVYDYDARRNGLGDENAELREELAALRIKSTRLETQLAEMKKGREAAEELSEVLSFDDFSGDFNDDEADEEERAQPVEEEEEEEEEDGKEDTTLKQFLNQTRGMGPRFEKSVDNIFGKQSILFEETHGGPVVRAVVILGTEEVWVPRIGSKKGENNNIYTLEYAVDGANVISASTAQIDNAPTRRANQHAFVRIPRQGFVIFGNPPARTFYSYDNKSENTHNTTFRIHSDENATILYLHVRGYVGGDQLEIDGFVLKRAISRY